MNQLLPTRVRGTEDLLSMASWNALCDVIKSVLKIHAFAEIRTPSIEKTELFVRAVGTDTDIVSKEMYTFTTVSEGSICLRPELTAPMVRAFYENSVDVSPWKVFQFGPAFRHERPQKGRLRQFYTCSIEVMNAPSVGHDISAIVMLDRIFKALDLKDYVLNLNFLGVASDRAAHRTALRDFLCVNDEKLCEMCRFRRDKNVLRVFDCKNEACQALYVNAPQLSYYFSADSSAEWERIKKELMLLSVNYIQNPMLVRGLDYYNGVVFEFTSNALGSQSTFCGGGRYDLSQSLGKKELLPSVGAGIGLDRVMMILEAQNNPLARQSSPNKLIAIVPMDEAQESLSLQLSHTLFYAGLASEIIFDGAGMKQKMRRADKLNAAFALVLGDREAAAGVAMVKDMATGESFEIALRDIAGILKQKLSL